MQVHDVKRLALAGAILLVMATHAFGQPSGGVRQNGAVVATHCVKWLTNNVVQDAGAACGSGTAPSPANPTATAGPNAVNGSATTYMRSDAAPAVQKGSNAQFGIVEGDTTSITCVLGVCSTVGAPPTGAAGGDLGGTYPNPTVTNGSHITNASVPNSGLVNPSTTVASKTCTLGSSCTIATTNLSDVTVPTDCSSSVLLNFGGAATGITYSTKVCYYTKVGSLVSMTERMSLSSKGSATGVATLVGFPVAANSTASTSAVCSLPYTINLTTTGAAFMISTSPATTFSLEQNTTGTVTDLTNTLFADNTSLLFTCTYVSN